MRNSLLSLILASVVFISFPGCAPQFSMSPTRENAPVSGLSVISRDNRSFIFHENNWKLTFEGISGVADISSSDWIIHDKDTTLSYWEVVSASPANGRGSTMSQFLLTILGVILILGLAAIVLYAAFLATER